MASASIPDYAIEARSFVVRARRWLRFRRDLISFVADILLTLTDEHATGKLTINLTQGCATHAEFEERATLNDRP
jgi:hypothetical protein